MSFEMALGFCAFGLTILGICILFGLGCFVLFAIFNVLLRLAEIFDAWSKDMASKIILKIKSE